MNSSAIVFAFVSIAAAAACGGKSPSAASGPAGGGTSAAAGDDAATPFDDGAVKAALAAMPGNDACGTEASTTMGAHFAAQREGLVTGGDGGNAVDESFRCQPTEDGVWECQWSVFARPSGTVDPDDPCGEGGTSGYIIIAMVGADGALAADKIYCNAPG